MNIDFDAFHKKRKRSVTELIKDKMQVLDDFNICDKNDKQMKEKLREAIAKKPDRDPGEVLDYYCRPIIQDEVNSWI